MVLPAPRPPPPSFVCLACVHAVKTFFFKSMSLEEHQNITLNIIFHILCTTWYNSLFNIPISFWHWWHTEEKTQKQTTNSQFSVFEKSEGRNKVPLSLIDPLASFSEPFFSWMLNLWKSELLLKNSN